MKLYMIRFDGMPYHVEAESFGHAIDVWHRHQVALGTDWDGKEEPEEVVLVGDEPVIRENDMHGLLVARQLLIKHIDAGAHRRSDASGIAYAAAYLEQMAGPEEDVEDACERRAEALAEERTAWADEEGL